MSNKIKVIMASLLLSVSVLSGADEVWDVNGTIAGSPHDLAGTNANDNGELCVYCHTPHAGNSDFNGAPLWNKSGTGATTYQMYGASSPGQDMVTIGTGTVTGVNEPANPSLACLSCHDGVSAIDSIVNAPGSGARTIAGTTTLDSLKTADTLVNALTNIGDTNTSNTNVDLRNDHPVSIPYVAGVASLRATNDDLPTVGANTTWVGATKVSHLLRSGNVECGSCHDPHKGYSTDQNGKEVNFLRYSNTGSGLCFGCHAK